MKGDLFHFVTSTSLPFEGLHLDTISNVSPGILSEQHLDDWERDGFLVLEEFADQATCDAMYRSAVAIARASANDEPIGDTEVVPETILNPEAKHPEENVAKITRLHHEVGIFAEFIHRPEVGELIGKFLGDDVDCFASSVLFKHPGSLGQPWHQDAWYFRMHPSNQISLWLAVTKTTIDSSPLWVLPGSHHEPVHPVDPDLRVGARPGYVAITDHEMGAGRPLLVEQGSVVLFGTHVMHRSTGNLTDIPRVTTLYHFGSAGTHDPSVHLDEEGWASHVEDVAKESPTAAGAFQERSRNLWIPIRRSTQPI